MGGLRKAGENLPVLSMAWNLVLSAGSSEQRHLIMALDQVMSMRFFGTDMPPLWRRRWHTPMAMLEAAENSRGKDLAAMASFNEALIANLSAVGGDKYAALASL